MSAMSMPAMTTVPMVHPHHRIHTPINPPRPTARHMGAPPPRHTPGTRTAIADARDILPALARKLVVSYRGRSATMSVVRWRTAVTTSSTMGRVGRNRAAAFPAANDTPVAAGPNGGRVIPLRRCIAVVSHVAPVVAMLLLLLHGGLLLSLEVGEEGLAGGVVERVAAAVTTLA